MKKQKNNTCSCFCTTLLLFLITYHSFSQREEGNNSTNTKSDIYQDKLTQNIIPPSAAVFQQTKLLNVNNYTGSASIGIPLYEIIEGDISIPIRLNYVSTGVKANEVASNVGLNWSLEAGGSVTKVIKGYEDFSITFDNAFRDIFPEEKRNGVAVPDPACHSPLICQFERKIKFDDLDNPLRVLQKSELTSLGWFLGSENLSVQNYFDHPITNSDKIYTIQELNAERMKQDTYPDFFYANAPGLSTEFTHRKNKTPFEVNKQGNKITTTIGKSNEIPFLAYFEDLELHSYIKTYFGSKPRRLVCINNITITNINGVEYVFNELDVNQHATRGSNLNLGFNDPLHVTSQEITSYHLSSMKDVKGNSINFEYEKYSVKQLVYNKSQDYGIKRNEDVYALADPSITEVFYPQLNRIKRITYSKGTVDFIYLHNRLDQRGDKALTDIIIKDNHGKFIKKIKLDYDYFVANTNGNNPYSLRLKLKKVTEYNAEGKKLPSYELFYDETQLPELGSHNVDYLGYANGVKDNYDNDRHPTTYKAPYELFYKFGKKRLSFSPMEIFPGSYRTKGVSLRPSFKYTQAGTLLKIKKPTGAMQLFTYELNSFSTPEVKNITAAGLRLKKQIVKDEKGHIKLLEEYSYVDEKGATSGVLNSMPLFGDVNVHASFNSSNSTISNGIREGNLVFRTYSSSKNNIKLVLGNSVGYSRVIVKNGINNGTTERQYYTVKDNPIEEPTIGKGKANIDPSKDGTLMRSFENGGHFPFFNNKDVLLGKLKSERIFNFKNEVVQERQYTYKYKLFEEMKQAVPMNKSQLVFQPNQPGDFEFNFYPKIYSHRNLQTHSTNKILYPNKNIEQTTINTYDSEYPLIKESKSILNPQEFIVSKNYYPNDVTNTSSLNNKNLTSTELSAINMLKSKHRIAEPIQTESYKNGKLLSTQRTNYKHWSNNITLPNDLEASKGTSILEKRLIFNSYNKKGNVVEASKNNGAKVYYVWGYNETKPIAKIEGYISMTSSQKGLIDTAIQASNNDNDRTYGSIGSEGNLRSKLNQLRGSFDTMGAQVTSYTYDDLIGITSITDPRGRTVYYNYDDFNRLQFVKDADNNVITQYCYNYKGQRKKCNGSTEEIDDVIIGDISSTTDKVFIKLEAKEYLIPIPASNISPIYTWDRIKDLPNNNDRESLNSLFHATRIVSHHPDGVTPFPTRELSSNLYNLNADYYANGYFKLFRSGYGYSLDGLENLKVRIGDGHANIPVEDFVLRWSMVIDGKEYPLIKPAELKPNVFFVPYCFGNKLGKIVCEIFTKDDINRSKPVHIIATHDIKFKAGFRTLDNRNPPYLDEWFRDSVRGGSSINFDCTKN